MEPDQKTACAATAHPLACSPTISALLRAVASSEQGET